MDVCLARPQCRLIIPLPALLFSFPPSQPAPAPSALCSRCPRCWVASPRFGILLAPSPPQEGAARIPPPRLSLAVGAGEGRAWEKQKQGEHLCCFCCFQLHLFVPPGLAWHRLPALSRGSPAVFCNRLVSASGGAFPTATGEERVPGPRGERSARAKGMLAAPAPPAQRPARLAWRKRAGQEVTRSQLPLTGWMSPSPAGGECWRWLLSLPWLQDARGVEPAPESACVPGRWWRQPGTAVLTAVRPSDVFLPCRCLPLLPGPASKPPEVAGNESCDSQRPRED